MGTQNGAEVKAAATYTAREACRDERIYAGDTLTIDEHDEPQAGDLVLYSDGHVARFVDGDERPVGIVTYISHLVKRPEPSPLDAVLPKTVEPGEVFVV